MRQIKTPTDINKYLNDPRVVNSLKELNDFKNKKPFIVSDVLDNKGNQYVDLVQKGGGVWGVALVGYTYILEEAGIRFRRLAGTSAGAINTALMIAIGGKQDAKSSTVLQLMCELEFFNLVDGHPFAKWMIKKFISNTNFTEKVKSWAINGLLLFLGLIFSSVLLLGLEKAFPGKLHYFTVLFFVLTGIYLVLLSSAVFYFKNLLRRLKNAGFGINPGDFFYDWLKCNLKKQNVTSVDELIAKASQPIPGVKLRESRNDKDNLSNLNGDVTFIASELVTENKILFPQMCDLFRSSKEINNLSPAGFVRASMSIPLFFESYYINEIPIEDDGVKAAWQKRFQKDTPPSSVRFVDGGMLSNFPVNLFFDPTIKEARLPTFGIDLTDETPGDNNNNPAEWTLGGYVGRLFNTIRYYYDKDFLLKNEVMKRGVGTVNMLGFNWLNFSMTEEEKIEMFARGAEAATLFLKNFDWKKYKDDRMKLI